VCNAQVLSATKEGSIITSLTTADTTYFASIFIDASFEGDLMGRVISSWTVGREPLAKYNESLAGVQYLQGSHKPDVPIDPFVHDRSTKLLPFIEDTSIFPGNPGDGDEKIQSYNFRLCVTQVHVQHVIVLEFFYLLFFYFIFGNADCLVLLFRIGQNLG
jgi:hypothetical protein